MNSNWSKKWKAVFTWLCGYLNIVAFAIVGGYNIIKSEDDELKKTTKKVLIVTLILTAISAFLSLFNYVASFSNGYYSSAAYDFYTEMNKIANIAKIVVFAVFIIIEFVKKDDKQTNEPKESEKTIAE